MYDSIEKEIPMKKTAKRVASLIVCAAMLAVSLVTPYVADAAETLKDDDFTYLVQLPGTYGCSSAQGMAVGEEYVYAAMVGGNTVAAIWRFNKENGQIRNMKNGDTGEQTFSNLGHVNDMDVAVIDGVEYLFVLASGNDIATGNIIVFRVDGRTLYQKAHYTLNYNGGNFNPSGMAVYQADNENITFAFKWSYTTISTGSIAWDKDKGSIAVSILCYLDSSAVEVNGKERSFTGFANQGIYVYGDTLFAVYAGCYAIETVHQSLILGFDLSQIEKGTPTLKPREDLVFYMESENFPRCFEVEDCGISSDGKLYFNANCWKSTADTTHDGVFVLNDFVMPEIQLPGDVNGDGKATLADAIAIGLWAKGCYPLSADGASVADVNGDGRVNLADSLYLLARISSGAEN